jgi:type VI secretion system secreted protein Hcp
MNTGYTRKVVQVGILALAGLVLYALLCSENVTATSTAQPRGVPMACDMFITITGIAGESTDRAHQDWIEVQWFNAEISQPVGAATSGRGGRTGGRVEFGELVVGKRIDRATPLLHQYCCTGKHIAEVDIEFCRPAGDKRPYYVIKLKDVIIASVGHTTDAANQTQLELVSLRFGTIEWHYTPTDRTGQPDPGNSVTAGWDLTQNKQI